MCLAAHAEICIPIWLRISRNYISTHICKRRLLAPLSAFVFSFYVWLSAVVQDYIFVVVAFCALIVTGSGLWTLSNCCHRSKGLAFYLEMFTHRISCYPLCLTKDTSVNTYSESHNRPASTNLNIERSSNHELCVSFSPVWPDQTSSPSQSKELLPEGTFKEERGV